MYKRQTPHRRPEVLLGAQTAIKLSKAKLASDNLQTWVTEHPLDATAWQLMAAALLSQGRTVAAIRAEAEVNIAQLNYADALTRLQAAQDAAKNSKSGADYFEASIVDSRLKQVQQIVKEQSLER